MWKGLVQDSIAWRKYQMSQRKITAVAEVGDVRAEVER